MSRTLGLLLTWIASRMAPVTVPTWQPPAYSVEHTIAVLQILIEIGALPDPEAVGEPAFWAAVEAGAASSGDGLRHGQNTERTQ